MRQTKAFILLLFNLLPLTLAAKKVGEFHNLSIDQGLSQNTVHCIFQDSKGFMWFGTRDGLNRYDGYTFKKYYHDPKNRTSLSDNTILTIHEDRDGMLWIGTYRAGVNRFDPRQGHFTRFTADGAAANEVRKIAADRAGVPWIGTWGGGLYKFDRTKGRIIRITSSSDIPSSSVNYIADICAGRSGKLWIACESGLKEFDPGREIFTRHFRADPANPRSLSSNDITCVIEDALGMIWLGTFNHGLNRLDPKTGEFTRWNYDPDNPYSLSNDSIDCILETRGGDIWVGSWRGGGLSRFDRKENKFFLFKSTPANPLSLSQDRVNALFESRSGTLWVGTFNKGVDKYTLMKEEFVHIKKSPDSDNSLGHNVIAAIHEDRAGNIWIGTRGRGLDKFDREKRMFSHFGKVPQDVSGLNSEYVYAICEDRRGRLWFGTLNGLYTLDRESGTFTPFASPADSEGILARTFVTGIAEDHLGIIWVGTFYHGLYAYNPEAEQISRYTNEPANPNSLSHQRVSAIYPTRSGTLWIGTSRGLNRFDRDRAVFSRFLVDPEDPSSLSHDDILSLCEDHKGNLWVGTHGGGLNKMAAGGSTFMCYTTGQGLPNNVVYGILEDEQGFLWLSTNKGLSRFDPENEAFLNYTAKDGLQSDEFCLGAYHKSRTGVMYFGGINGLNAFYPERVLKNLYVPPIVITAIKVFRSIADAGAESPIQREIADQEEIVLAHHENTFSIEFAALDYINSPKNRYAYMLEGLDKEWVYTGERREALFSGLAPGVYVFRAKGSNNSGIWNEKGVSRKIKILAPPKSPWPLIAAGTILLFSLLILTAAIRRKKRLAQQKMAREIDRFFSRYSFSSREMEIIRLLIQGKSKQEIEDELFISPHTVKNHIYNIYQKLGIKNRLEIIKLLHESKIIG